MTLVIDLRMSERLGKDKEKNMDIRLQNIALEGGKANICLLDLSCWFQLHCCGDRCAVELYHKITKSGWSYPHKKDKMKFQVLSSEGYSQNLYHPAPWDFPALVEPLLQLG